MTITYQTTDFKKKEITLENAVNVRINGIKITEYKNKGGLDISVDSKLQVLPNASNSINVKEI